MSKSNPIPPHPHTPILPYGRQSIDADDVAAVVATLRSDFLTQGPAVEAFETAFADKVGAKYAVAVNSGTAALHACMAALGIGVGEEVIVPPITFTATANCAVFVGATPVFADVTPSGHIDPEQIERKITKRTKAVIAVDYAGLPCDYAAIRSVCERHGLHLVCDACHSLGATWNGVPTGSIGVLNCFSFHPVKHIATGEGGMVTTDDAGLAQKLRDFRTHGITKEPQRFAGLGEAPHQPINPSTHQLPLAERGPWYYEMQALGFNYRMPDLNAALGRSQLKKLDHFVTRRREIARQYYEKLSEIPQIKLPVSDLYPHTPTPPYVHTHSFHLFPLQIDFEKLGKTRTQVMTELRARGVGTQVHYIPVHLQPFYRVRSATVAERCHGAEFFYASELSIPMYPVLSDAEIQRVIDALIYVLTSSGGG